MGQAGYVYIVHGIGTPYIKVGTTTNMRKCLRNIARTVPFPMRVLSVELVCDMDTRENELFARYADYRCKGGWFALPENTLRQWPLEADIAPWTSLKEVPMAVEHLHPKERAGRLAAAKEWLRDFLGAQEIASVAIVEAAAAVGMSPKALRRAKESLRIQARKRGNRWYWGMPDNAPQIATENT